MNKTPGLTRCDYPICHTRGWYARIYLIDKRIISKYFADKSNGGSIRAGKMAAAWLRIYLDIYRKELPSKVYRKTKQINNKTGKTGVHYSYTTNRTKTHKYYYYAATWHEKGKLKHLSFYVSKYPTKEDAFWAALEHRNLMEQRLDEHL